jgi:formylglycine-generating enzyme required for sulfatase activity
MPRRLFVIRTAGIVGSAALLLGCGGGRHIEHASIDSRPGGPGAPANIRISAQPPRGAGSVHLEGGSFRMGTDTAEIPSLLAKYPHMPAELFAQETPAHDVLLTPFDIDRAEVTVKAFAAFVDANPRWKRSQLPASLNNGKYVSNWTGDEPAAADSALPVTFVTWYAATAYCEWRGARLPTEAEWEFAARAGHPGDAFPWGDGAPTPDVANWSATNIGKPVAVAHYDPNAFGLYDMAGNVWQYTADRWRDHYSDSDTGRVAAPSDILAMKPAALALEASRHVIRGGSFDAGVINMRVRYRDSHPAKGAGPHVGFRCARSASSPPAR